MGQVLAALLLLVGAVIATPATAAEAVMTAPRIPSADQATTLIFSAEALGHDLDPSTQPVASAEGTTIRIDLNAC